MKLLIISISILFGEFNFTLSKNIDIPQVKNPFSNNKSIYGINSMKDYYQINADLKKLADSTVALVMNDMLSYDPQSQKYIRVRNYTFAQVNYLDENEDFANNPTLAFCSGSLVAKNLVLTAAHCINEENYKKIKIVFNWKIENPGSFPTSFNKDDVYDVKSILIRNHQMDGDTLEDFINTYRDYAILELDRDVIGHQPLKVEKFNELSVDDYIFAAGYPSGIPIKVTEPFDSKVAVKGKNVYKTNTDLLGGNSGGPAFDSKTYKIVGIVVTGELEYIYQTVKDFTFLIAIDSNIQVGKISFIKPNESNISGIRTDQQTAKNLIASLKEKGSSIVVDKDNYIITVYKDSYFTNREGLSFYVMLYLGGKDIMGKGKILKYPHNRYGSGILKILNEFSTDIP